MQSFQMLCVLCALAPLAASLKANSALKSDAALAVGAKPVMQVVRMLQDAKTELQAELEDDEKVHEMLECWCKKNMKEKGMAILAGQRKLKKLEAIVYGGNLALLQAKREAVYKELVALKESLQQARELRLKEAKELHQQEKDLIEAIKAAQGAIVVLAKENAPPDLAQLRSATRKLLESKVVKSSTGAAKKATETLTSLVQGMESASSFLEKPGYQSYAPQSSQVFGILKQMKEDFEENLDEHQKAMAKAEADFEALKKAKSDEIALGEKELAALDAKLADGLGEESGAYTQLEAVKKQLELDLEFMRKLKAKCSADAEAYEVRVKSRMEEIAAVEDALKVLNSGESFELFDKMQPMSFIQTSSTLHEDSVRRRAGLVLQQAAARTGAAQMVALAASVRLDALKKVKKEIDKMIAEMNTQMTDEVEFRDRCISEFNANELKKAAASDTLDASTAKLEKLEKDIGELTESIETEKKEIAETEVAMKEKTENREKEKAEAEQTIADHHLMSSILQKAINRLKEVYLSALQVQEEQPGAPHTQTSASADDPGNGPARFKKYQAAKGSKVVALLEDILDHTKKTTGLALNEENNAQTGYDAFMKDSNTIIVTSKEALSKMSEDLASMKEELSQTKEDIADTKADIERLDQSKVDLHAECDYVIKNFEVRQSARSAEIDALREAKGILSGAQ